MLDVVGIGSIFVDYFFETGDEFLKKYSLKLEEDTLFEDRKIPPAEIFNTLSVLNKSTGGISSNTIAILAKLGLDTGFHGVIGEDKEADYFINNYKGVNISHIKRKGRTSRCACLLTHNRKYRSFMSELNPCDNEIFEKIDFDYLNDSSFVHVGPFFLNPEKSIKKLPDVFRNLKNTKISFSPGIVYIEQGFENLAPLLKETYILFTNQRELKQLSNRDLKNGSKYLLNFGPKIVVCTMGEKGVLITSKEDQFFSKAKKVEKIIDTTGAGDAFAAGFLYGLVKNKPLRWSAEFANKIAARSLSNFGLHWLRTL